jgi:hypothetical protein
MLDGLDLVLRWYLRDVRPKLHESSVLFCDQSGGTLNRGTIRNRLRYLQNLERCEATDRFSPYGISELARPTTTNVAWIWSLSSSCLDIEPFRVTGCRVV